MRGASDGGRWVPPPCGWAPRHAGSFLHKAGTAQLPCGARDSFLLSDFVFLPRKDLPLASLTLGLPKSPSSSPANQPEAWSRRNAWVPGLARS